MNWFGRKPNELSTEEKRRVLNEVLKVAEGGHGISLRALVAASIGDNVGAEDQRVTSLLQDIRRYGLPGLDKKTDITGWWENANAQNRKQVVELTVGYVTSR